ncbi:hypothetical protein GCM10029964_054900 [Kibdelosporangium lantanae]
MDHPVARGITARGGTVVPLVVTTADRDDLTTLMTERLIGHDDVRGVVTVLDAPTSALVVIQAAAGLGAPLWMVTSGAVAVGTSDERVEPLNARLWGLGRVAGLEHPTRWGGLIDVPPTMDDTAVGRVCAVLAGALGHEDQLAVRTQGCSRAGSPTRAPGRSGAVGARAEPSWSPAAPAVWAPSWPGGWSPAAPSTSYSPAGAALPPKAPPTWSTNSRPGCRSSRATSPTVITWPPC